MTARRPVPAGGGSLADERSQLVTQTRRDKLAEQATPTQVQARLARRRLTFLAAPCVIPGTRIPCIAYDSLLVDPLPAWLADHLAATEAGS